MAGRRVEQVPIERLSFGLSPRAEDCDRAHVAALMEVLSEVPPILVHAPTMRVIDGVHRVRAAQAVGRTTILAVLFDCDETVAHIEAVRSNVMHGKPLSLAEREAAAVGIIERVPEWSDRRIGTVTGLSPKTVARLRSRATVDRAQSRARLGRDDRVRPVDPAQVRERIAQAMRSDPDASDRAIARRARASPATVRDVRKRLRLGLGPHVSRGPRRRPSRSSPGERDGATQPPGQDRLPDVVSEEFAAWFEQHHIDEADWRPYVAAIPISRVYEVADACRQRSDMWRAFSRALEDRARGRRRSSSPNSDEKSD